MIVLLNSEANFLMENDENWLKQKRYSTHVNNKMKRALETFWEKNEVKRLNPIMLSEKSISTFIKFV